MQDSEDINVVVGTPADGGTKVIFEGGKIVPAKTQPASEETLNTENFDASIEISNIELEGAAELQAELLNNQNDSLINDLADPVNPVLAEFWDKEIENNPERKAKLDAAGIGTYSLMLAEFNNRYINYVSFMRANFTEEQMEEVEGSDEEMYIEMIYCII